VFARLSESASFPSHSSGRHRSPPPAPTARGSSVSLSGAPISLPAEGLSAGLCLGIRRGGEPHEDGKGDETQKFPGESSVRSHESSIPRVTWLLFHCQGGGAPMFVDRGVSAPVAMRTGDRRLNQARCQKPSVRLAGDVLRLGRQTHDARLRARHDLRVMHPQGRVVVMRSRSKTQRFLATRASPTRRITLC